MSGRILRSTPVVVLLLVAPLAGRRALGESPDITLKPAAEAVMAQMAAEIAAAGPVLPRDGLLISPIPGLTTAWHPAPQRAALPAGSRVRFLRAAHPRVTVVWRGATEVYRDARWSMAEVRLDAPGERQVEVDYVLPNGQVLTDRTTLEVVRARAQAFRVTGVRVEAAGLEGKAGPAAVTAVGAGRYRAAPGSRLRAVATTEPAGFAPLVEWRVDGATRVEAGPEIGLRALPPSSSSSLSRAGELAIAAGPPGREASVRIEAGDVLDADHVPVPAPGPVVEAFTSTAQVRVTLDVGDPGCATGLDLTLTSSGLDPTVVERAPPPYANGQVIPTEITALELGAFSTDVGHVLLRQRADQPSLGRVENVVATPGGQLVSGRSSFDVFIEVELPELGMSFTTGDQPIHLEAMVNSQLPPFNTPYEPVEPKPVPLLDPESGEQVGWICHAAHTPLGPALPTPGGGTGGGTTPDEDCFTSTGQTTLSLSTATFTSALQALAATVGEKPTETETMEVSVALSSEGLAATSVLLDPGPYEPGDVIATEMVRLELGGHVPGAGMVVVRERQDRRSLGRVIVEAVDADGGLVAGHASFDLFLSFELPEQGMTLHTGMEAIHVTAGTISGLPPVGTQYEHDPDDEVELFNAGTFQEVGTVGISNHWPTRPQPCPCSADLDIDSDNNNGVNPPDRSAAEEAIEENPPGKYIGLNDDDDDGNKVRDLAEEPIRQNPPEDDPVWMVLEVKPNTPPDKWSLTYPAQVQVYDMDVAPPQILPSGVKRPAPLTPNPKSVKVEGVQTSTALGDVVMVLTYECQKTDEHGYAVTETVTDKVVATVIRVDLDVDSDNSNATAPFGPQRDQAEDDIEDDVDRPGRYVQVNDDDDDQDGVVDLGDGFNLAAGAADDANAAENDFVRMVLEVPAPIDLAAARLRFTYSASDPAAATSAGAPPVVTPAAGRLRVWKRNGNVARNRARANAGGDYVHTTEVYTAANLGLAGATRTVDLWIEGIAPSLAQSDRILVEVDPDGAGPAVWVARDAVRVTVVRLGFIADGNAAITGAGQDARLMVSNLVSNRLTDAAAAGSFPRGAVTFNGDPTGDPDVFRAQLTGAPAGLAQQITVEVIRPNNAARSTTAYGTVTGNVAGSAAYRTNEQLRLVSNAVDDAVGAGREPTRLGRLDEAAAGDRVRATATIAGQNFTAELPVCRPFAENHNAAIRTAVNYYVVVDIAGTAVAANADPATTTTRMSEAWAQCCVRHTHTTRTRAPVTNLLRFVGNATGAGNVSFTIDGAAVGPVAIAAGTTAVQAAQLVAAAINAAVAGANAAAFNTFPPINVAHVAGKRGNNAVYAALANTAAGLAVSVPALNFGDGIEFTNEEPALAANFGDNDANTMDFFIVDTLTTGNRGDAWPVCHASIGATSALRNTSFIVLSAGDAAADNPHTAAHEAGRFILNFCGLHAGAFNLQNGTSLADAVDARKRLEDAQCTTARTTSDGTILRQQ